MSLGACAKVAPAAPPCPGLLARGAGPASGTAAVARLAGAASAPAALAAVPLAAGAAAARAWRRGRPARALRLVGLAAKGGDEPAPGSVGVVLLSAGVGKRMGAKIPKQYLKLLGLEIALHSLEAFLNADGIAEIVIVCAEDWRSVFEDHIAARGGTKPVIKYTGGGAERQDSVCNGLAELTTEYAAVHDAARPLVTAAEIEKVVTDAKQYGAALLAVQTKATIKQAVEASEEALVAATPNRKFLWEAHTPQVIKVEMLRRGFENAAEKKLAVTDDVSLVEFLGEKVKLTEGEYTNIKVTTPEDIAVAETILRSRGFTDPTSA